MKPQSNSLEIINLPQHVVTRGTRAGGNQTYSGKGRESTNWAPFIGICTSWLECLKSVDLKTYTPANWTHAPLAAFSCHCGDCHHWWFLARSTPFWTSMFQQSTAQWWTHSLKRCTLSPPCIAFYNMRLVLIFASFLCAFQCTLHDHRCPSLMLATQWAYSNSF